MGGRAVPVSGDAAGGGAVLVAVLAAQTTTHLAPLDAGVIVVFLAAILALGFSARLRSNTVLQFLAAGRALTLPVFIATLVSTWYGGILGVGESVSYFGLGAWVMIGLPYYVFAVIYALLYSKRVRAASQISIPERIEARFGRAPAIASAVLVLLLAVPAAHVLMLGVLVRSLTGWEISMSVLIATILATTFLYKGGLLADARVSMLAFSMMYFGFAVIAVWCLAHFPIGESWGGLESTLLEWDGGQSWPQLLSFFVLGAWTLVDPGFHQRVASAATPEISKRGVMISAGFWCLFDVLSISTAMYALALTPLSPDAGSLERLAMLPALGDRVLPPGLKAVFLCGMLGTIVAAMVGYALVGGATLGREIFGRLFPAADEPTVNRRTRIGIGISCAAAIVVALSVESVVALWYTWSGAVVGALLWPVAISYGLFPKSRCRERPMLVAIIASACASLAWMAYGLRTGNPFLEVRWAGQRFSLGTLLPGLTVSAAMLLIGELLAIIRGDENGRERINV